MAGGLRDHPLGNNNKLEVTAAKELGSNMRWHVYPTKVLDPIDLDRGFTHLQTFLVRKSMTLSLLGLQLQLVIQPTTCLQTSAGLVAPA